MDAASPRAVYFLSDYGNADEFAGVVRAVLFRLAPGSSVIDLSHEVPPYDVAAGADMLVRCVPHLGAGVVLAVVDPGVGTNRRGVAIHVDPPPGVAPAPTWLVGPDNGLLVPAAARLGELDRVVELAPLAAAATFDGRDLFAPAAAHLVRGGEPGSLGSSVAPASLVTLPGVGSAATSADRGGLSAQGDAADMLVASVTWIDRFGNVQLDLGAEDLDRLGLAHGGRTDVELESPAGPTATHGHPFSARRVRSFAELEPGELGVLIDANGRVALVFDRASAAGTLGFAGPGAQPQVRFRVVPDDRPR
jgi:S-adenosylmethionine hydrolase